MGSRVVLSHPERAGTPVANDGDRSSVQKRPGVILERCPRDTGGQIALGACSDGLAK